ELLIEVAGDMSAGILSRDETQFLTEVPIPALPGRRSIRLAIDDAARGSALVFRTYATANEKPRLTIFEMRVNGADWLAPQPAPQPPCVPEVENAETGRLAQLSAAARRAVRVVQRPLQLLRGWKRTERNEEAIDPLVDELWELPLPQ